MSEQNGIGTPRAFLVPEGANPTDPIIAGGQYYHELQITGPGKIIELRAGNTTPISTVADLEAAGGIEFQVADHPIAGLSVVSND